MSVVTWNTLRGYAVDGAVIQTSYWIDLVDTVEASGGGGGGGGELTGRVRKTLTTGTISAQVGFEGATDPTLSGDKNAGWVLTCPSDSRLTGVAFNIGSNDLDGSLDLILKIHNDAPGNMVLYPAIAIYNMNNGQVVREATSNIITSSVSDTGELQLVINNLNGFGTTGVKIVLTFI